MASTERDKHPAAAYVWIELGMLIRCCIQHALTYHCLLQFNALNPQADFHVTPS